MDPKFAHFQLIGTMLEPRRQHDGCFCKIYAFSMNIVTSRMTHSLDDMKRCSHRYPDRSEFALIEPLVVTDIIVLCQACFDLLFPGLNPKPWEFSVFPDRKPINAQS